MSRELPRRGLLGRLAARSDSVETRTELGSLSVFGEDRRLADRAIIECARGAGGAGDARAAATASGATIDIELFAAGARCGAALGEWHRDDAIGFHAALK